MEILLTHGTFTSLESEKTYFVVHFSDMVEDAQELVQKMHTAGCSAEMYPTPEKIGKQIQYADKK